MRTITVGDLRNMIDGVDDDVEVRIVLPQHRCSLELGLSGDYAYCAENNALYLCKGDEEYLSISEEAKEEMGL